jgi:hypothetical protein
MVEAVIWSWITLTVPTAAVTVVTAIERRPVICRLVEVSTAVELVAPGIAEEPGLGGADGVGEPDEGTGAGRTGETEEGDGLGGGLGDGVGQRCRIGRQNADAVSVDVGVSASARSAAPASVQMRARQRSRLGLLTRFKSPPESFWYSGVSRRTW